MANLLIIVLIGLIVFFSLKSSKKHFNGQGGCCGSDTYVSIKKDKKQFNNHYILKVNGIKCEGCISNIEHTFNIMNDFYAIGNYRKKQFDLYTNNYINETDLNSILKRCGDYSIQSMK